MGKRIHSSIIRQAVLDKLQQRGVQLEDIAEIVLEMQSPYHPALSLQDCLDTVLAVLEKRELQHALLVGIELDELAERGILSEPLLTIVRNDEALFGCDETLAIGSVYGYGSIALTTFGHLDKQKTGIIKQLDTKNGSGKVHTFLDDLVASIAASAAGRIAHRARDEEDRLAEALEAAASEERS